VEVRYRKSFLRDLKKIQNKPAYDKVFRLAFEVIPNVRDLRELPGVKALSGHQHRFRIRLSSFRIGIQVEGNVVEIVRVLDRRDFYRYFP
jgi:mRNA-degrading endonuclease RelE of RelBE toxin-antitoxin system